MSLSFNYINYGMVCYNSLWLQFFFIKLIQHCEFTILNVYYSTVQKCQATLYFLKVCSGEEIY